MLSEGFQKKNKGAMVKMLDENLTFLCHFPVLVQISSTTWTTHLDLALTVKRYFVSTE